MAGRRRRGTRARRRLVPASGSGHPAARGGSVRGYRFLDGRCPDRENLPPLADTFETAAYPLHLFTDAPHTSAHKQRMIELLLADEERGIGLELPDLPPGAARPPGP